jgi:branched-subunit amino acid transport protein AzlD
MRQAPTSGESGTQATGLSAFAPEAISIAAVVLLYRLTRNSLIAIPGGTVLYMALIRIL